MCQVLFLLTSYRTTRQYDISKVQNILSYKRYNSFIKLLFLLREIPQILLLFYYRKTFLPYHKGI